LTAVGHWSAMPDLAEITELLDRLDDLEDRISVVRARLMRAADADWYFVPWEEVRTRALDETVE